MKGYYIHYDARTIIGVSKKIDMHLKQLRRIAEVEEICIKLKTKSFSLNALAVLPFMSLSWDYSDVYNQVVGADFIYIRGISYDRKTLELLKWIKVNNPNCRVLSEIPTYPDMKERLSSIQGAVLFPKTIIYQQLMKKYIDRYILTVQGYTLVHGIPVLSIRNGVDFGSIRFANRVVCEDRVRIIAVAMMQPAHGYERLIDGLKLYYNNVNDTPKITVSLTLVGDGPEISKYIKMVADASLEEHVKFCGEKTGDALDKIYDDSDIAVDALGWYKFGIDINSSLKCGEYMAKGLPVISGVDNDNIKDTDNEYFYKVPNNSEAINIEDILRFYNKIYKKSSNDVNLQIRECAKQYYDIRDTFGSVLEYIKA